MSTELDLGAMRTLADVCARMGHKVRLTPAELSALLAAAGERDGLRAERDALASSLAYYEDALVCPNLERLWMTPEKAVTGAIEPERVAVVMRERDSLQAEVERLRSAERTLTDYELVVRKYCGDEACDVDGEYNVLCDALRIRAARGPQ